MMDEKCKSTLDMKLLDKQVPAIVGCSLLAGHEGEHCDRGVIKSENIVQKYTLSWSDEEHEKSPSDPAFSVWWPIS